MRYGSQAIGGVVNAINDRIPEIIPPRGFSVETRGGLSSVDRGADGAFKVTAGAGNFAVHADAFKRHAGDYDTPAGRQFNTFVDSEGFAVGTSLVGRDGFIGIAFSRYNSLYGIPGEDAIDERTRIDMQQDKIQSRGEWRVRDYGIEAIRFWFGSSDYAHNEIGFEAGPPEIGSRFTNKENEGRIEVQHLPVTTAFGELRGAVGAQFGQRKTVAISFEGDCLLDPARTNNIAAFWFEELQVTKRLRLQAAARIEQTPVDGVGLDLSDPLNTVAIAGEKTFRPISASAGILYELPMGVVARLTGQYVERAPADAELFSKGVHEATETFEIGNPFLDQGEGTDSRAGVQEGQRPVPLRRLGLLHAVRRLHFQAAHRAGVRRNPCVLRLRHRAQSDPVPAARRDVHRGRAPGAARRCADLARRVGYRRRSTTSCGPGSTMHRVATYPAFRRIAPARASTIATSTGLPASASCTRSTRTRSARTRRRPTATRC